MGDTNYMIYALGQTESERQEHLFGRPYSWTAYVDGEEVELKRLWWYDEFGEKIGEPILWTLFYHVYESDSLAVGPHTIYNEYSYYNGRFRNREKVEGSFSGGFEVSGEISLRQTILHSFLTGENRIHNNAQVFAGDTNYMIYALGQTESEREEHLFNPPYTWTAYVDGEEVEMSMLWWYDELGEIIGEPTYWVVYYHIYEPDSLAVGWHTIYNEFSYYNGWFCTRELEYGSFSGGFEVLPVPDDTPPIIDHPEDIAYAIESTGNLITWIASDDHPDTFTVLKDGGFYESGVWESGSPITINIDGLLVGTYGFVITVYDTYGNFAEDTVLVTVHEVDDTPPNIFIQYQGTHTEDDAGHWAVYPYDEESGLGEVYIQISFEGEVYYEFQETLDGIYDKLYEVPLQGIVGIHTIKVIVKNDINYDGVQETNEAEQSAEIEPYIPPDPELDDDTPPIILEQYDGNYVVNAPGEWTVYIYDEESGLGEVSIQLSFEGEVYYEIQENLGGVESKVYEVPLQGIEGIHTIKIIVKNDINYDGVQETSELEKSIEIEPYQPPVPGDYDDTPPEILLQYEGTYSEDDPGHWAVYLLDEESGLGEVYITISFEGEVYYEFQDNLGGVESILLEVPLQGMVGIHTINVIVKNNINYDGVQETSEAEQSVEIKPYVPPEPT
ncbi:MAG: hypothetical protein ACFE8T_13590 [Promethearchaeota archaeon]